MIFSFFFMFFTLIITSGFCVEKYTLVLVWHLLKIPLFCYHSEKYCRVAKPLIGSFNNVFGFCFFLFFLCCCNAWQNNKYHQNPVIQLIINFLFTSTSSANCKKTETNIEQVNNGKLHWKCVEKQKQMKSILNFHA